MVKSNSSPLRVLELFAGIGGCAAAIADSAEVVAAVDIHRGALEVYSANFSHPTYCAEIESIPPTKFVEWNADLWWLSPPCQPYTRKGSQRDLNDPRAKSLLVMIDRIRHVRPGCIALENVPPFAQSQARAALLDALINLGYDVRETLLCPTQFGVPNRRHRYYLTASRNGLLSPRPIPSSPVPLVKFLEVNRDADLTVSPKILDRYANAIDIVCAEDETAVTSCFAAAYGRSPVRSGSYLKTPCGIRYFSPGEILKLLGFPADFRLPTGVTRTTAWSLVGNSLAVPVVRYVLEAFGISST